MKPATAAVLALLREAGEDGLSPIEALKAGAGMRLAARIAELREAGYAIDTDYESDRGATFARYRLEDPDGQRSLGFG